MPIKYHNLASIRADFSGGIAHLKSLQASTSKVSHLLAVACMAQFQDDGNLELARQFYDALDMNSKQNQFTKWICDMSGQRDENGKLRTDGRGNVIGMTIRYADNKFTKIVSDDANDTIAAININNLVAGDSFLKYAQEKRITMYSQDDVVKRVLSTFKRFASGARMEASTPELLAWVSRMEAETKSLFASNPVPVAGAVEVEVEAVPAPA